MNSISVLVCWVCFSTVLYERCNVNTDDLFSTALAINVAVPEKVSCWGAHKHVYLILSIRVSGFSGNRKIGHPETT